MHEHRATHNSPSQLRVEAEARLQSGTAPEMKGWPTGTHALQLLHQLASNPASAGDALKLLHELQVHQVELDLQHEQGAEDRRQLTEDRARYLAMFELAPLGYLTVDTQGRVLEANRMACEYLGLDHATFASHPAIHLADLLSEGCRLAFRDALQRLQQGSAGETMTTQSKAHGGSLFMKASPAFEGHAFLMAFMPLPPAPGH